MFFLGAHDLLQSNSEKMRFAREISKQIRATIRESRKRLKVPRDDEAAISKPKARKRLEMRNVVDRGCASGEADMDEAQQSEATEQQTVGDAASESVGDTEKEALRLERTLVKLQNQASSVAGCDVRVWADDNK